MNFILKMAWRDSRASRRRLVLFSLSVVLGIAALVAIGSLGANLERTIDEQAKGLLGSDLMIVGRAPLSPEAQRYVDSVAVEQARDISFTSMMAFPSADNLTRLVNVRAGTGNFPFYGDFLTTPADAPAKLRAGGDVVIVEETLLRQFDVPIGGKVKLGNTLFTVVGALQKLPGESSAIAATMAPRALIPQGALSATGLAERNALSRHRTMLKLAPTQNPRFIELEIRRQFRTEQLGIDTVEERKRNIGRAIENIEGFLSLVGFVALFLGGIGVASAIHDYVRQKITTVAVLRCLGATAWQSFAVYLVQGVALGIFGAVVGATLGLAVQALLPLLLQGFLPFEIHFVIVWPAVLRGMAAGLIICVLFTLLPLLAIRNVSPLVALRAAFAEGAPGRFDPWRITIGVFIVAAVAAFAIEQTTRLRDGIGFTVALVGGFAFLAGLAKVVAWAARKWSPRRLPYVMRQGVANLYRPNNRTVLLLVSLGLGTFLMLTLFLTRTTLLKEIEFTGGKGRANLLFFDIQDDQIEALRKTTAEAGAPVIVHAPIVTMRVAAINGVKVEELLRTNRVRDNNDDQNAQRDRKAEAKSGPRAEGERGGGREGPADARGRIAGWTVRREYRSSFRGQLEGSERLVSGEFIGQAEAGAAVVPISVEESLMRDMSLRLGDELEWDIQGVAMRTKITSVRAVEWRRLEPNFFVLFPLGVLEGAPKFHVAAVRANDTEHSARLQRTIVTAFPNVTAIDVALIMQTVDGIFTNVALIIEVMAAFTVLTGIIVLIGAVLTGRFQRIRETVLLRTLGATRRQLVKIQLVEYAILGALAAFVGCLLAVGGNALLAKFIFRITPSVPVGLLCLGGFLVCCVTIVTGLLTSRGITDHPPLEVLRQET